MSTEDDERISVSRGALRAELKDLELRLVDRLNSALDSKADKVVQEQHTQIIAEHAQRLTQMEGKYVPREDAIFQQVEKNQADLRDLRAVAGYKKWLWAQTIALIAIALPILGILVDHWVSP